MSDIKNEIVRHIPHLRRFARGLVNSVDVADDLVQDCLERAWTKREQWDSRRDMRPWLFTILHNIYANNVRRYKRTPSMVSYPELEAVAASPDEQIDLTMTDLQRALDQVSDEHREILLLIGLEQMSYKDSAEVLGIPIGTVMSRLTRARKRLRELMTDPTMPMTMIRRVK
jgi:RNA polymerase sigma-70 factor (ECF subfamily)